MKVVEITYHQECECSLAVGMWNYWDHEHVLEMHEGVRDAQILFESPNHSVTWYTFKAPIFSFISLKTLVQMTRVGNNKIVVSNTMWGMPVLTHITITEPRKDYTFYDMKYQFVIDGWKMIFAPLIEAFLRKCIPWWNARQWREDLPIKLRRQKVLRLGFKDFKGMPENITDRVYEGPIDCNLPVPRPRGSPVDRMNLLKMDQEHSVKKDLPSPDYPPCAN